MHIQFIEWHPVVGLEIKLVISVVHPILQSDQMMKNVLKNTADVTFGLQWKW